MTDTEPAARPAAEAADGTGAAEGIRDRSVREVVERTRDAIRKTRELLDNSRDLLDRVRNRDGRPDGDEPGEHDAGEASGVPAGVDARLVDGRA